ncbi:SDR family NAD(P)-dependent oxidoreductase [Yinghuangia seranimata]|uniref:SDR family NAD(P)-dependent oxidoreductase n=1 Tax=Yinghuangia seranimata TaxID=408067 RepID=UPI00248BB06B|nr:SDR family oxidoreductase [Yinghuangia seranimata]MDI2131804.1 SDR family oxidoreductase [Yinghuangia seranimata]
MTRTDDTEVPDYPGRLRLDGKGVVVLGAGQGIGRQATHALAQAGAKVLAVDLDPDLADDVAKEVDGHAWAGDATSREAVAELWRTAEERLGRVHALVDIIGMSKYQDLLSVTDEDWDWHQNVVLRHALLALQYGGAHMARNGGGAITFVASVSGLTGAPMHAAYGAAKAALMSLVRSASVELGPSGVRVNAVAPGVVWTPRVSAYLGDPGRAANAANAPLRDVARPADIAGPLLFLTGDLSRYVSGQVLTVDGGVGVKFPYPLPDMEAAPH